MNCRDNGRFAIKWAWILARDQKFRETDMYDEVLEKAIREFGFQTQKTIIPQQDDCHYDYIGYYPDGPAPIPGN